jgi:hypothetical protein
MKRQGLRLVLAGAALGVTLAARSQALPAELAQPATEPGRLAIKSSQPPVYSIAVAQLGFSAPGALYLGQRSSFISLDFLDEDRLLFTFRVPGLIRREAGERGERRIRAVVLGLPSGRLEAEALWTVHDSARYLWALNDGRFLLRDRENLQMGDAALELKAYLHFPGALLWMAMDPAQQYLVTDSREPEADGTTGAALSDANRDKPEEFSRESGPDSDSAKTPEARGDLVVRILRRDTGQVLLVSRSRSAVHLPVSSEGYLESEHGRGDGWQIDLNYFTGGRRVLGQVESSCLPVFEFLSPEELLASTCTAKGSDALVAIGADGRELWRSPSPDATIWPLIARARNGLRLAREALAITHPLTGDALLYQNEIQGQRVEVMDAANGRVALTTSASPVMDAGGNVAISPTGRRVAVLADGVIQIFELPAPPPLPSAASPAAAQPSAH